MTEDQSQVKGDWHQDRMCKDQTRRNLSLTHHNRSPFPQFLCSCLFLKDIHSQAERQLKSFLSTCPVTESWAEQYSEMRVPYSCPIQWLDQGCSTARCCHRWQPHLLPPTRLCWKTEGILLWQGLKFWRVEVRWVGDIWSFSTEEIHKVLDSLDNVDVVCVPS